MRGVIKLFAFEIVFDVVYLYSMPLLTYFINILYKL